MSESMPKLSAALVEAQLKAQAVGRDAKNEFHRYKYASAESMIQEGRSALGIAGLSLVQRDVDHVMLDRELEQGKERARVILRVTYALMHTSGEERAWTRSWPCVESNGRPIDKAFGGALTTALAYTIRDLLLLPRDDEQADMDRRREPSDKGEPAPADVGDRDPKPANTSQPANDACPPRATEHPFLRLLPLIQSRTMKPELLAGEIDKSDLTTDERKALDFVVMAFTAKDVAGFTTIAANVRKAQLGERLTKWVLESIKPAWQALQAPTQGAA